MTVPRPSYGITEIHRNGTDGFYVRVRVRGKQKQKFFSIRPLGGRSKALSAAMEHRDQLWSRLSAKEQAARSKPKRKTQKSGVPRVVHTLVTRVNAKGKPVEYHAWEYSYVDKEGKRRSRSVSFKHGGSLKALEALLKLKKQIDKENSK